MSGESIIKISNDALQTLQKTNDKILGVNPSAMALMQKKEVFGLDNNLLTILCDNSVLNGKYDYSKCKQIYIYSSVNATMPAGVQDPASEKGTFTVFFQDEYGRYAKHEYSFHKENGKQYVGQAPYSSSSRKEIESHGFSMLNSSAIAIAAIPKKLLEEFDTTLSVPGIQDLEEKIREVKTLGARVSNDPDLTELKKAHKELETMLSEFLEVQGNTIHAECNNNGVKQEIVDASYDEISGLSLEGRSNKGLFGSRSNFSFDNSGSKRLNLTE